jgi:hypothetical protein
MNEQQLSRTCESWGNFPCPFTVRHQPVGVLAGEHAAGHYERGSK